MAIKGSQEENAKQDTISDQTGIRVVGDTVFRFENNRTIMLLSVELRSLVSPYKVLEAT